MPTSPTTHHHHADHQSTPPKPTPIVLSLFFKPIVMLFILSIFLFLGIAVVSLLLLLLTCSSLHLCRRRRSTPIATSSLSVQDLQNYLPRFRYDSESESAKDCAVCLECFRKREWCRRLPDCNHVFHVGCLDSWLTKVLNCPICRAPVQFNSSGSGSFNSENDDFKSWWTVGN